MLRKERVKDIHMHISTETTKKQRERCKNKHQGYTEIKSNEEKTNQLKTKSAGNKT
jgi:hypothetical protein